MFEQHKKLASLILIFMFGLLLESCQIASIEERLISPTFKVREEAVKKFQKMPQEKKAQVVNHLLPYIGNRDNQVANRTMNTLVIIGGPAVAPLASLLKHPDLFTRLSAVVTLGQIGVEAAPAIPNLLANLQDAHSLIREESAFTLGEIGPEAMAAVPLLTNLQENDSAPGVRQAAKEALKKIKKSPLPSKSLS